LSITGYDAVMRTTITLDDDTADLIRARMKQTGAGFKQVVNDALRDGLGGDAPRRRFRTPSYAMGTPAVPLDRALALAADVEDDELVRKAARRA